MTDSSERSSLSQRFTGLVEIDGYHLSASIVGAGAPPVVYLSGLWVDEPGDDYDVDPGDGWQQVLELLGALTTAVLYDRGGVGRSDPVPEARRTGGIPAAVEELRQLLAALRVAVPVVLVGHSLGGRIAESFARAYPRATAGLVSVDGTPMDFYQEGQRDPLLVEGRGGWRFQILDNSRIQRGPVSLPIPAVVLASNVERWTAWGRDRNTTGSPLAQRNELWQGWQRDAAARLGAAHITVPTASHVIHRDVPSVVAHAIDAVVRATREHRPRAVLDPRRVHEAGGQLVTG